MAEFHFLRPVWLLLLPVLIFVAWRVGSGRGAASGWRAVVDRALQPFVLREGTSGPSGRGPLLVAVAAAALVSLALAGPAWDRLPVPAYRSDEALVVALDLSRSMDATDVEPTRLARARLKLLDLLDRRTSGQTALVVFTSNAFTVTPLTSDTRTIKALVNALSTEIMPSRGSLLEVGIDKSAELLRQSGATRGDILLITDATASPAAFADVERLNDDGISTSVLAVGTENGAPIPVTGGGFLTDQRGQVVIPQLNFDNLQRLASAGGGRFARMSVGDGDLDRLFPADVVGEVDTGSGDDSQQADIWRDQGIWLTLALLPLIALGFRRGWIYLLVGALWLPPGGAEAFEWSDLWLRGDQRGARAFEQDAPDQAAVLFDDPEWRAAAAYRAGQYEASAAALGGIDAAEAHYNRGNALARAGRLAEAIDAYDRTLELAPEHDDAAYNRELVAELLEQQQQENPEQEQSQGDSQPDQNSQPQSGEQDQQNQDQAENSDNSGEQQPQQASADQQDPGSDQQNPDQPPEGDQESDPETADEQNEEQESESSLQAQVAPEDVEDWASEQAADQWLRRIPQDPGGLLRRKFLYQYQQLGVDQDGNRIYPGGEEEPW